LGRARRRNASIRTELLCGAVTGLGLSAAIWGVALQPPAEPIGLAFVALAALLGGVRFPFPRVGRLSLRLPATLAAMTLYGLGSAVVAAGLSVLLGRPAMRRVEPRSARGHTAFEAGVATMTAFFAGAAYLGLGGTVGAAWSLAQWPALLAFVLAYESLAHALARVAAIVGAGPRRTLRGAALPLLVSSSIGLLLAALLHEIYRVQTLRAWLLAGPAIYVVYLLGRARADRFAHRVRRGLAGIDIDRSITQVLARAVAALDDDGERHLWRVRGLCLAVGRKLEMTDAELDALASAALLHDLGKLAIPEPILSKPGKLSDVEMDQIKIHPAVGAELLERIAFPAPIHAIVRHHHERWDGAGYPDGLDREEIPLGARVLAAADCYDALTSERPFRRALPDEQARRHLRSQAGSMFDPEVVDALLECLDEGLPQDDDRRADPQHAANGGERDAVVRLPTAERSLEGLQGIARAARYPVRLEESLTLVAEKLRDLVPHSALVVYLLDEERRQLRAIFAAGRGAARLRRVTIPAGERLSGWSVMHQRAIAGRAHTSPLDRDGMRSDLEDEFLHEELNALRSSLVAPLVADGVGWGALALYDVESRCFGDEDRRNLVHAAGHVALAVRRWRRASETGDPSLTDPLTGLPNARMFWMEAARRLDDHDPDGQRFGLLAFRLRGLAGLAERSGIEAAERTLGEVARRLASCCRESELLVRFGQDLFLVLAALERSSELVERWGQYVQAVEERPLRLEDGTVVPLRLVAAHASRPEDGADLDGLLASLESRLTLAMDRNRKVMPFRRRRSA